MCPPTPHATTPPRPYLAYPAIISPSTDPTTLDSCNPESYPTTTTHNHNDIGSWARRRWVGMGGRGNGRDLVRSRSLVVSFFLSSSCHHHHTTVFCPHGFERQSVSQPVMSLERDLWFVSGSLCFCRLEYPRPVFCFFFRLPFLLLFLRESRVFVSSPYADVEELEITPRRILAPAPFPTQF